MPAFTLARLLTSCAVVGVVTAAGAGLSGPASAAAVPDRQHYQATPLGTLDGVETRATSINDRGDVVGITTPVTGWRHGFVWRNGTMTDLGYLDPKCPYVYPTDINNRGQVVGTFMGLDDTIYCPSFLWQDGHMSDLGSLGGPETRATDINDRGQVVGYSATATGELHAFLWQDGRMTDLGVGPPVAIDNRGRIAGTTDVGDVPRAYLRYGDTLRLLEVPEGMMSVAHEMNDRGWIVGYTLPNFHAALWRNGRYQDLGDLWLDAVNDRGQIIGTRSDSQYGAYSVLWQHDRIWNLEEIGGPRFAADINNHGQLAGYVTMPDGSTQAAIFS